MFQTPSATMAGVTKVPQLRPIMMPGGNSRRSLQEFFLSHSGPMGCIGNDFGGCIFFLSTPGSAKNSWNDLLLLPQGIMIGLNWGTLVTPAMVAEGVWNMIFFVVNPLKRLKYNHHGHVHDHEYDLDLYRPHNKSEIITFKDKNVLCLLIMVYYVR